MKSFGEGHGLECENCLSVDWGSPTLFSGKVSEIPIGQQEPQWRVDAGVGIGIESAYSSSADACSVSEFGSGCSPKSSISASIDSSSKSASKVHLNFQSPRGISRDPSKKKEFIRVEDPRNSLVVVPADGRNEHMIGLKLGKRTYFEDVCAGINIKSSSSSSSSMPTTNTSVKKLKMPQQGSQTTYCQVEGCNVDLAAAKDYHRKHRVCETHSKCPKVIVAGQERRFCQQCSRFHQLSEFDQKKRSCRRRLADHNARRRKPQPEMISFHSARLFSSCYEKYEMNLLSDRELYCHTRPNANWTRGTSWDLKLNQTKEPWSKPPKTGGFEGQLHFPGIGMSNTTSAPRNDLDKILLFKGTTAEVLNQGLEASAVASNLAGAPDLRRALSLLSTDTWGSADPGSFSLLPLVNKNLTCTDQPSVQAIRSAVDIWQDEQPVAQQARASSFNLHANGGQFHEFQQLKTPYEADFFDSSQIN